MIERHDEKIDDKVLEKIRTLLDDSKTGLLSLDPQVEEALSFCLTTIDDLRQENESLWFMLDEIHASGVDEHTEALNKALQDIKLEFLMKRMKAVDA